MQKFDNPKPHRKRWWLVGLLVLVIALMVLYGTFDPSDPSTSRWFPKCVIHATTGLQCPGCGSQRAIHSLLNADFAAAWHYNALLFVLLPFLVLLAVAELLRTRVPGLYNAINNRWVSLSFLVILAVWMVVRNLVGI